MISNMVGILLKCISFFVHTVIFIIFTVKSSFCTVTDISQLRPAQYQSRVWSTDTLATVAPIVFFFFFLVENIDFNM